MVEMEFKRKINKENNTNEKEIKNIKNGLIHDYLYQIAIYNNNVYFNLPVEKQRYEIELEAYNKRQRLNELEGEKSLPALKINKII